MAISVTNAGLIAAQNAEAGGFLVNLTEFSVTAATGFQLDYDATGLVGTELYRGRIQSIENVGPRVMRLTCVIPRGYPTSSSVTWNLGELGIWTNTGVLFAHGYKNTFPKTYDVGLKFYVLIPIGRLNQSVFNITQSDVYSLPSSPRIDTLQPPSTATQNSILVFDGQTHFEDQDSGSNLPLSTSPTLAVKYGAGGSQWGFVGQEKVYVGVPDNVVSLSSFTVDPNANGFWLTDREIVIVQAISGEGEGETRKFVYGSSTKLFTALNQGFTGFDNNTRLAIWRSAARALPKRTKELDSFLVLGVGANTYVKTTTTGDAGEFVPYNFSTLGNGGAVYPISNSDIPTVYLGNSDNILVYKNGVAIPPDQFSFSSNALTLPTAASNTDRVDVKAFGFVAGQGGENSFQEVVYTTETSLEFLLPVIPPSKAYVSIVNLDTDRTISPALYSLTGSKITFNDPSAIQPTGSKLAFLAWAHILDPESRSTITRDTFVTTTAVTDLITSKIMETNRNVMVYINGAYIPKADYTVVSNRVVLNTAITGNNKIDIMIFTGDPTVTSSSSVGADTGPLWVDPAGFVGESNTLTPNRFTFTGNGSTTTYTISNIPSIKYAIIFVDNKFAIPGTFVYSSGQLTKVGSAVPNGQRIEIIAFTSSPGPGAQAACRISTIFGNGTNSYPIQIDANPASLIVTLNGDFQPSTAYIYDPSTGVIQFPSNLSTSIKIEVWSYDEVVALGFQTRMNIDSYNVTGGSVYSLSDRPSSEANVLSYLDAKSNTHDLFNMTQEGDFRYLLFNTAPAGTRISSVNFSSTVPQTRLMLRTEADTRYLKTGANLSDLFDSAQARINIGILDSGGGAVFMSRSNNLSDVLSVASSRTNLSVYSKAEVDTLVSLRALRTANLSDLANVGTARTNLNVYSKPEVDALAALRVSKAGDTMTGRLVLPIGAAGGFAFPADPFGGSGDNTEITLLRKGSVGEDLTLNFKVGNDPTDTANFELASNSGLTVNGFPVYTSGNISVYTKTEADAAHVLKIGDTMTGPLQILSTATPALRLSGGRYAVHTLSNDTAGTGSWVRIAQIQQDPAIGAGENSSIQGILFYQNNFGGTSTPQGMASFNFGVRPNSTTQNLIVYGDYGFSGGGEPAFQIWRHPTGLQHLYFYRGSFSGFATFQYSQNNCVEAWVAQNPTTVSGAVKTWDSATGAVQGIRIGGRFKVWHEGNDGAGSGLDADTLDTFDSSYFTNIPARLGYTPVQQGTGIGQLGNTVKIGWNNSTLKGTVDGSDLGSFIFNPSPNLLGNPTAVTQATLDNSTRIATTAHVFKNIYSAPRAYPGNGTTGSNGWYLMPGGILIAWGEIAPSSTGEGGLTTVPHIQFSAVPWTTQLTMKYPQIVTDGDQNDFNVTLFSNATDSFQFKFEKFAGGTNPAGLTVKWFIVGPLNPFPSTL